MQCPCLKDFSGIQPLPTSHSWLRGHLYVLHTGWYWTQSCWLHNCTNDAVYSSGLCNAKQMPCPACNSFFWKWQLLSPTQTAELLLNDTLHLALTCNFRVYLQFLDASTGLFRNGCLHSHHTHTTFRIRYTPPLLWRFQTINQDFQTY